MPLQVSNTNYGTGNAPSTTTNNDLGRKDIFLKLLVAQMKNQDPQKPQDATQMSSQLAQFNMVEQQTSTNQLLEKLVANGGAGGSSAYGAGGLNAASASFLGRTVTVNQSSVSYTGSAPSFSTDLAIDAADAQVVIRDASGQTVRTMNMGAMAAGKQVMSWDGMKDNGTAAALGTYSLEIKAIDFQGQNIIANVQRSGVVDAVRLASGDVQLMVAGTPASLADITEVRL
ncbi:MAG: flagellar hook capping FlgD N-terminal domain-containing protein [Mariprofundaceae bacterium]